MLEIALKEEAKKIVEDEGLLKSKLCEFLDKDELSTPVLIVYNDILSAKDGDTLKFSFQKSTMSWFSFFFSFYMTVYRRLWLALVINIALTSVFSIMQKFVSGSDFLASIISIVSFCITGFVFGKLYTFFLAHKFISYINDGKDTTGVCRSNLAGLLLVLFGIPLFIVLILFILMVNI